MNQQNTTKSKNRKTLLWLLFAFLTPVVAAKLVLKLGWYQGGQLNKGELIQPPIALSSASEKWLLLYAMPRSCDAACKESLWQQQQVFTALGKYRDKVRRQVLSAQADGLPMGAIELNQGTKPLPMGTLAAVVDPIELAKLQPGSTYLVDPLGTVIMRYQFPAQREQALLTGKAVLRDFQRLLKLSRFG